MKIQRATSIPCHQVLFLKHNVRLFIVSGMHTHTKTVSGLGSVQILPLKRFSINLEIVPFLDWFLDSWNCR